MRCWVCDSRRFTPCGGSETINITPDDFKITDSRYGLTMPRFKCADCGFVQCDMSDVTVYYERLEDKEYIDSGEQRALQFHKLLNQVARFIPPNGKILDIGAGSGLFVKEALLEGYSATGIEPSKYLADKAKEDGLPVVCGTFPRDCAVDKYDSVFLTDVIEHLTNPVNMLAALAEYLTDDGVVVITTPDVSSAAARLLGPRWWHYRIAHVGYYDKRTLAAIMSKAGFVPTAWKYAKWYFSADYIVKRLSRYLPFLSPLAKIVPSRVIMPVNLFDSRIGIFTRERHSARLS
jgi:2-polyprenyl-3-methyl-5-hydroxy-6-metoxy-1,4-benzoquinol methylase